MKLNKDIQYGLLLVLYISRGGRVTLDAASENLNLSKHFLAQVARKLRIKGVINSVKGAHGGYELNGAPTVNDVFQALSPVKLLTEEESVAYRFGPPEHRALYNYIKNLQKAMSGLLDRKAHNVMMELVANEMAKMDRLDMNLLEN